MPVEFVTKPPEIPEWEMRFPVLEMGFDPISANEGLVWLETGDGVPHQLRTITENSTGGFESVLISLSS